VGAAGVEVMRVLCTNRVGRHVAVLLADLVAKLVQIDQIEYLSHH
jgi:hypothetical protein